MQVKEIAVKYHVQPENNFALVHRAQNGIPVSAFFDLLEIAELTSSELSSLLNVSYKTMQRYQKEDKKLSALNSEQVLKMIVLYQKAEEIFGDLSSFNRWLRKPAQGLGGQKPLQFMQTPGGIDLIYEELVRIEFGAFA